MDNHIEEEQAVPTFYERIRAMNEMYKLHVSDVPCLPENTIERLRKFKKTLSDELDEIDLIIEKLEAVQGGEMNKEDSDDFAANIVTDIADLFCDINVYCVSESLKYGIPHEEVLDIIMDSNESKLADDGIPIYDENGKFQKDVKNYWKPEPMIKNLIVCMGPVVEGKW